MIRNHIRGALFSLIVVSSALAQSIVVSPHGPVTTLVEARDAARAQHRTGKKGPVTIIVHGGTYYLPETLVLGPEDSDTIWEAPHGEHPVISGGRLITGWQKKSDTIPTGSVPGRTSTWIASVPASIAGGNFHQLFVDGSRGTRARTPNKGFYRMDGDSVQAQENIDSPASLHFRGEDIKKAWTDQGDVELIELMRWSDLRRPIVSVNEVNHAVTLAASPWPGRHEKDARYYIENAPDALDAAGEWYLDRGTGTISYNVIPGENMERAVVIAPSLVKLVSLEGDPKSGKLVHNITFRGLTFEHADWSMGAKGYADEQAAGVAPAAIEAVGTENFTIEHSTFAHSGGYAVYLGRGSKHSRIIENEIYDMGAGGIKVGENRVRSDHAEQNYGNTIADNQIHDLGLVFAPGVGIWVLQSGQNQIVHNHIHDTYYTAISVGWTWHYGQESQAKENLIAYNNVHDIGKGMLSDMGGIYTFGEQPGTIIRNNLIHDISPFEYGGWGIYLDETSSDILVEDNVAYGCTTAGFFLHYGRDNIVRNNIFAFNRDYELMASQKEDRNSVTFERNIIDMDHGGALGSYDNAINASHFIMRNNLYHDTRGNAITFAGQTFSEWQGAGYDHGSLIADPHFVNAASYDFRLQSDSPALKIGFQQIDLSTVGPRERAGADGW